MGALTRSAVGVGPALAPSAVVAAYDAIAGAYDRQLVDAVWIRRRLWRHHDRLFRPGERVLDVGCGTGADALRLARRGVHVTAIDVSPQMLRRLEARAAAEPLSGRLEPRLADCRELATWRGERFDGIVSSFAALNTLPDLTPFAAGAASVLRPGGRAVLHLLNRVYWREGVALLAGRRWGAAAALGRVGARDLAVGDQPVRHYLYPPGETYRRFFADAFALRGRYAMALLRPPGRPAHLAPGIAALLGAAEAIVAARQPFVSWGRFFVLDLARR